MTTALPTYTTSGDVTELPNYIDLNRCQYESGCPGN